MKRKPKLKQEILTAEIVITCHCDLIMQSLFKVEHPMLSSILFFFVFVSFRYGHTKRCFLKNNFIRERK